MSSVTVRTSAGTYTGSSVRRRGRLAVAIRAPSSTTVADRRKITAHARSVPDQFATSGRSAIMNAFAGQAALQPASGAPPGTTGEKNSHGTNAIRKYSAYPASSSRSARPVSLPSGTA